MEIKDIKSELQKLSTIVEGWSAQKGITAIERDLALEKLRALYEAVRFCDAGAAADTEADEEIDLGDVLSLDVEIEDANELAGEVAEAPAPVVASETEPAPEPMPDPEPAPASESQPKAGSLFGEEVEAGHRRRQRVIMSLYHAEEKPAEQAKVEKPAEAAEPAKPVEAEATAVPVEVEVPVEESEDELVEVFAAEDVAEMVEPAPEEHDTEPVQPEPEIIAVEVARTFEKEMTATGLVLGEVMNHDVQTLGDTIAAPHDMASEIRRHEPVTDLHLAVGINDKFLMIRDLFEGDGKAYDRALDAFNGFDNLDDCMIHIAENYVWNPNSDGAKLLVELLERKFA